MPGKPAARVTDMHVCPMVTGIVPHVGGPILPPCSVNVITGKLPQARFGDMLTCVGPPDIIVLGSRTVLVNKRMAARMGDTTAHGGKIILGFFTVLIGESGGGGSGGSGSDFVQTSSGSSSASAMLSTAAAMIAPAQQAAVYKAAARAAAPFCERCTA